MAFAKDTYVANSDPGLAHAVARSFTPALKAEVMGRHTRKLPSNMSMFKKAKARAGSDLIDAVEDKVGGFAVSALVPVTRESDGVQGFGLHLRFGTQVGRHITTESVVAASITEHCAARVLGRTVHRADRALLREALTPALRIVTRLWVQSEGHVLLDGLATTTLENDGDQADGAIAVVNPKGALLGRVRPTLSGRTIAVFSTWVDAGTAADKALRKHARETAQRRTARLLVMQGGEWQPAVLFNDSNQGATQ